jgi:signal transduction histidine kinase
MRGERSLTKSIWISCLFLGGYAGVSLWLGPGRRLYLFAAVVLCLAPLAANLGLLANSGSRYRRQNIFWTLWAIGCLLWSVGELIWAIGLLSRNRTNPPGIADIIFFLSVVPMLGALAVRPHRRAVGKALRYGYADLGLLAAWCVYLYGYFVLVPGAATIASPLYERHYIELTAAAGLLVAALLGVLWRATQGSWRRLYTHLLGAASLHVVGWLLIRSAIAMGDYRPGSLWDLPLLASFLWLGIAGLESYRLSPEPVRIPGMVVDHRWALRLSVAGVISLPLLGAWSVLAPSEPNARHYRIDLTLGTILVGVLLLLMRQRRVDAHRRSLMRDTQRSLEQTNRLQAYLVLNEKLASLGDLAAAAAREMSDPLTAIFGYTEMLLTEPEASQRVRSAAHKIQTQARRTRTLVDNLLRFARQVPAERTLLDLNALLSSVVQLHRFHLSDCSVIAKVDREPNLPAVRGDPKLLLQVFYEIIDNAADAMRPSGGGRLNIRTHLEGANVAVEFADSGPGLEHPELVFDPFYTTKEIGKGTGLGLSMCYGIIQEHGGQIACENREEGGALFRIELPAVMLPLPLKALFEPAAPSA